ncbi:hypothetical protein D0Z07_3691 [Hyphodiscus hymeniophilus]|uniref:Uncharacterized protein n=1 Tax=Hyphodiscus hymeniophilus TaxID=353542 RepID=A0A9P6VLQ8_9HELO|nr:hypothetical protein D0Z07_3691 [Hyphodiscus hymeniophilus]
MDSSPSKRRKTSQTTPVPGDAPTTPSRIPVRIQPLSVRPSFASPTKASLSKHHPQLLRRSSSVGAGAERPGSRGRDIQDVFAKALAGPRPSIEGSGTPLARDVVAITPRGSAHRRARSDGGGLSAKPRRMSRYPFKHTPKAIEQQRNAVEELQENIDNPFIKRGLRRSPPAGSQTGVLQDLQEHDINPFEKRGLRRSPMSSQAVEAAGQILVQFTNVPEVSMTVSDLLISKTVDVPEMSKPPVRRGSEPYTTQSTEPITVNSFERNERANPTRKLGSPQPAERTDVPDTRQETSGHLKDTPERNPLFSQATGSIALNPNHLEMPAIPSTKTERLRPSEPDPPIVLPRLQGQREQHLEESSKRTTRASQAEELLNANRRQPEEPELPPTPTQLGIADPIVTTPPTGIHDTPSRRARKKYKQKSSPLKPRDPPPPEISLEAEPGARTKPRSRTSQAVGRRRSARFLIPEDPYAAKREARDNLLKELQKIQADVAFGIQENERLRLQHESNKKRGPSAPSNPNELLDMLIRATAPEPALDMKSKPKSIFKCIDSFLPFTSRRKRLLTAFPNVEKPLPSYLPVALEDSLPYLQVFSPLVYTSTISLISQEHTSSDTSVHVEQPNYQLHRIKASHPSGLFSARLSMVVDSSLLSITSLDIEALPFMAEKELGTFMREQSNSDNVFDRNIGVLCWAMGRWVEVSVSRARFWATVEQDFTTLEARAKSLEHKVRKRKRRGSVILGDDDATDNGHEEQRKWTMRQLLPHMGRTVMELNNDEIELRFEWRIGFDWTGEAESAISASARLPKSWQSLDDRKSLHKIPASFDKLVKERGPLLAVRTIVGLLMPAL